MKPPLKYISRGIVLDEETWKRLQQAREAHGSYNKAIRFMLAGDGKRPRKPTKRPGRKGQAK